MAKFKLSHDGWMIVADGEKALFLRNEGDKKFPNLQVFRELEQENPPTREQGTDSPGRMDDSGPGHRSAVQETDWHKLAKKDFASGIAERLYKRAHKGEFDELIIVAPPMVLGELRKEFHQEVSNRIIGEIDKDLTNHPVDQIEELVLE